MAKKLSDQLVKRMKTIGIKGVKTEDEARKKLLAFLEKQGIEGMEEEDTDSLIEMAESFGDEDEVMNEAEQEAEDLAEEAEDEEEESEEPAEDEEEEEEEEESEEDEEPEEEPAPKSKKTAAKKEVKKEEKKPAAKKRKSSSVKLNPKKNEEDRKYFKVFSKLFPESDYNYAWLSTNGVNIKNKGKNSNRSLVLIENCTLRERDGKEVITCNLYFSILNHKEDVLKEKDIDFENCWNGSPMIKNLTFDETLETIEEVYDHIIGLVNKVDKKLGENRKKMEESLEKTTKKEVKKEAKKETKKEEEKTVKKETKKSATKKSKK